MWPKTEWYRLSSLGLLVTAALLLQVPAHAADGLLTSSLGRWLDTTAAPELGEILGKHPKFTGETINLVSLQNGKPVEAASQLHQAVQDHLTRQLLQFPGVRLAWQQPRLQCGTPQETPYLLGVDIHRQGSQSYTVSLAMVDVAESVWVSGVNFNWRGRLTSAEKLALKSASKQQPRGSVDSPFQIDATAAIATLLKQDVMCSLPDGVDGPVFVQQADDSALNRILSQLQKDLSVAAMAAVTRTEADAVWTLSLRANPIGDHTQELVLTLQDRKGNATQQVASAFVVGLGSSQPPTQSSRSRIASTDLEILSPMQMESASASGIRKRCTSGTPDGHHCVEVIFELNTRAYLFVLTTQADELQTVACTGRLTRKSAGEQRYRVRIPRTHGSAAADAGLYAIAARDRSAARALANHLRKTPGTCNSRSRQRIDGWLRDLDKLLARHPGKFEWQAIHLEATPDGVVTI